MRSPCDSTVRRCRPLLEQIEDRFLPGAVLGLALWSGFRPLLDVLARTEDVLVSAPADLGGPVALAAEQAPSPDDLSQALPSPLRTAVGPTASSTLSDAVLLGVASAAQHAPAQESSTWLHPPDGSADFGPSGGFGGTVTEEYCGLIKCGPGTYCFGSDVRPVAGVLVVVDDLFAAVTGADGYYEFPSVPTGTYTVGFFVDRFGEARQQVTVLPNLLRIVDQHLDLGVTESPGQFEVQFFPGVPPEDIDALNEAYGVTVVHVFGDSTYWLRVPEWTYTEDFLAAYSQEPIVQRADRMLYACLLGGGCGG